MSIRDIYNRPMITDKQHVLTWGKYKGNTIEFVLELDPQYLLWASSTAGMDLDYKIIEEAEGIRDAAFEAFTKGI